MNCNNGMSEHKMFSKDRLGNMVSMLYTMAGSR